MVARLAAIAGLARRAAGWRSIASLVGKTLAVLFEKKGRRTGQIAGRSPYLQPVQVEASEALIGRVVPVEITGLGTNSLFGRLKPDA